MLVERTCSVGVEVIQHQPDLARMRISCRQCLTKLRELTLGASLLNLRKPSSTEWLNCRKQRTRAKLFVLIMLFGNLAFAHRSRQQGITNQEARALVKTHDRIGWIIRQGIER